MKKIYRSGLLSTLVFLSGCVAFDIGGQIQAGRMALIQGDPNVALARFQRVAQLDPDYLTNFTPLQQGVWTYVGRAYHAMGKLPEARQALEQAVSRYEQDSLAKLYLGLTLIHQQADHRTEKPFTLDDLIYALREGVAPRRAATLVKERGVEFELTSERENGLRRAGADDQLVEEIRIYGRKNRAEGSLRQRGLKQVEAGLKELHNWLEYVSQNTSYGQFWDTGREIRSEIQTNLAMISGGKIDWQKLIAAGEWVGKRMEEEIDIARRGEVKEQIFRQRR